MARPTPQNGAGVVRKKRLRLRLAFGPKDGTSAVEQAPARLQQWPQSRQQTRLQRGKLSDVAFAAQLAHVGVTAHDA